MIAPPTVTPTDSPTIAAVEPWIFETIVVGVACIGWSAVGVVSVVIRRVGDGITLLPSDDVGVMSSET